MQKLALHIERLLLAHDCVVIPGLGGFVVNCQSTKVLPDKHLLTPPTRKVGFNIHLNHNDGLLAQSLMKEQGCSYDEAVTQIEQIVQAALQTLNANRQVILGNIGKFQLTKSGQFVFRPRVQQHLSPEYFGLTAQHYSSRKLVSGKHLLHGLLGMAAVAAFLCVLTFPSTIMKQAGESNFAAMLSLKWYEKFMEEQLNDEIEIGAPINVTAFRTEDYLAENSMPAENRLPDAITDPIAVHQVTEVEEQTIQPDVPTKEELRAQYASKVYTAETYHIIIASLATKEAAQQYLQEIAHYDFRHLYIVEKDGRYRVSIKMFWTRAEADAFLEDFRANNKDFATAWILVDVIKG